MTVYKMISVILYVYHLSCLQTHGLPHGRHTQGRKLTRRSTRHSQYDNSSEESETPPCALLTLDLFRTTGDSNKLVWTPDYERNYLYGLKLTDDSRIKIKKSGIYEIISLVQFDTRGDVQIPPGPGIHGYHAIQRHSLATSITILSNRLTLTKGEVRPSSLGPIQYPLYKGEELSVEVNNINIIYVSKSANFFNVNFVRDL